jgi:hypothetical protein
LSTKSSLKKTLFKFGGNTSFTSIGILNLPNTKFYFIVFNILYTGGKVPINLE